MNVLGVPTTRRGVLAATGWLFSIWLAGLLACNLPAVRLAASPTPLPATTSEIIPTATLPATPTDLPLAATATDPADDPPANLTPPADGPRAGGAVVVSTTTTTETRDAVTLVTTASVRRYTVGGVTAADIDAQMRTAGPVDPLGGYHWYALTEPLFDWRVECPCADAGCTTGPVTMLLTLTYTLPQWAAPEGADAALPERWAAFDAALLAHEQGHGALAADCAWALGEAFAALPPQPSCGDVETAVQAASQDVFATCRAAQRAYENDTDHGRTQGVIWP